MTAVLHGHDMSGTTAKRPANAEAGQPYYDTDTGTMLMYTGSKWEGAPFAAEINYNAPIDEVFFVADRPVRVKDIRARVQVAGSDAGAVTAQIRKAPSGTAPSGGTVLHTGTINLKGTVDANQVLTLSATATDLELAAGDALALDATGVTTAARGNVTVTLVPR